MAGLRSGGGQHDQVRADLQCQPGELVDGQVGGQMVDQPAVLPKAGGGHQGRQGVPLPRRGGDDGNAPWPPGRLPGMRGEQSLADRAGPVLGRDGDLPGGPAVADPAQRRGEDPLAQVHQRHSVGQPGQSLAGPGLLARDDRRVQPVRLG